MFSIVFSVLASQMALAAVPMSVTYDDLPKLVREKNQNVTGAEQFTKAAEARTGHLVRSYLPVLRAEVGGEHFQTGSYNVKTQPYGALEARINLFRGGRDYLEAGARQNQAVIAESSTKKTYVSELTQARHVYSSLLFTRESIGLIGEAIKRNEQSLAAANRRIARGLGTETDRLEFEIYRSQLKEDLESFQHEEKLIEIRLASVLAVDLATKFKTPPRIVHEHDETLINTRFAPESNPDVAALKASQEASLSQKSISNLWWMPSLDVYGGYYLYTLRERDYLNQAARDDFVGGLRFTIELFDGYRSKSEASAFALQAQGYEEQAIQRTHQADAQVQVAKEALKHDHELIHGSEERIVQGRKYLSRTLDEYNRGVKNSIDVLSAAQKWLSFERQYAERRRDYQITKSGLLALMGQ